MSPTYFGLLAEFGAAEIRLEDCCEKYFALSIPQAKRRAMVQKLPVKVYRGNHSQKAGWLIDAADLAEWLDAMKAVAARHYNAMNEPSPLRDAG
jgi:hypothetical protein